MGDFNGGGLESKRPRLLRETLDCDRKQSQKPREHTHVLHYDASRVVAGEVKRLAQTTSAATGDVTRETKAIEEDIGQVASELHRFQDIIEQIEVIQNQLTSTIEDQTLNLSSDELSLRH
jgi:hypothetical protein